MKFSKKVQNFKESSNFSKNKRPKFQKKVQNLKKRSRFSKKVQNFQKNYKGPVPKKLKGLTQKIHTLIRNFNSSSLR